MSSIANKKNLGEILINHRRSTTFRDYIKDFQLIDLGFKVPWFTWTNNRGCGLIMERLDRVSYNKL